MSIRFATFNLKNLHDPGAAIYGRPGWTQAQYNRKVAWSMDVLQDIEADVIAFQEMWSTQALNEVFQAAGLDNEYDIITNPNQGGNEISNVIAVRQPHQRVFTDWIEDFPDQVVLRKRGTGGAADPELPIQVDISSFSRPLLRVTVRPEEGPNIVFYAAHLKSKRPMQLDRQERENDDVRPHGDALGDALSTIRRAAEAAALRVILNLVMRNTDTPVVVLGDLNDSQRSVTTSLIQGPRRHRLFQQPRSGIRADRGLYSTAALQQYQSLRDVYYTHIYENNRESLDHILVSEQFYEYSSRRVWRFTDMRIINDHLEHDHPGASDHGVVCATFEYAPD